jgi:WD40 repeat protein
MDFGPDGQTLVAGSRGGFEVWNLLAGTQAFFATPGTHTIFAFVMDPLGRWLYFSEGRYGCCLYSLASGVKERFPGQEHHVVSVAAALNGTRVAISCGGIDSNRLECWAIGADGRLTLLWEIPGTGRGVFFRDLAFHPGAGSVAGVEERRGKGSAPIVLRNSVSGEHQAQFEGMPDDFYIQTTFVLNGERLVSWDERKFTVWNTATGTQVGRVRGPGNAHFNGLAVHPSGRFFVTAAGDGHARYWDARTLKQTRAFRWQVGKLYSVAFSRDGMLAAAGGDKGQVVVWDVDS